MNENEVKGCQRESEWFILELFKKFESDFSQQLLVIN